MPASKCPNCGEWVTDWMTTCLSCGYVLQPQPPQAPPPPAPPQPPPPQPWPQQPYAAAYPPPPKRGRGRLWAALAGGLVLVLVIAGAVVVALHLRGDDGASAGSNGTTRPVTSEPHQVWAWNSEVPIEAVSADENLAVVTLSHHRGIVVLDSDGHELWRNDSLKFDDAYVEDHDRVEGVAYDGDTGSILFDRSGRELHRFKQGEYFYGQEDDGSYLISDEHDFRKVDPDTDHEEWSIAEGDAWDLEEHRILTVSGDKVTSYSRTDGSRQWTTTLPAGYDDGLEEKSDVDVAANDRFVLVSTGTLTALDQETGDRLWSAPHGGTISPTAGDRFMVVPPYHYGADEKEPKGPFPLYGVDGKVGTIDVPTKDGFAYLYATKVDGVELNVAPHAGTLYNADGTVAERGDDDLYIPFDQGFYTLKDTTIGYRKWHDDRAEWSITLTDVDPIKDKYDVYDGDISVEPIDRGLVINDRRTVWLYR